MKQRPKHQKTTYRKYNWVGNKIKDTDMGILYQMKERTKKPITQMVAEAVSQYITRAEL